MWKIERTPNFERGVKRCIRRGWDMAPLSDALKLLKRDGSLPRQYKPHKLSGKYDGLGSVTLKTTGFSFGNARGTS